MRTAILMARRHGQTGFELVLGPETPIVEQREAFKDFQRQYPKSHPEFGEIQLWESDRGEVKTFKVLSPEEVEAKAKGEEKRLAKETAVLEQKGNAAGTAAVPGPAPAPATIPAAGETNAADPATVPAPAETTAAPETAPAPAATPPAKPAKKK